jgi:protein TonB
MGTVIVEAHVDLQGRVKDVTVVSGNPLLSDAAREAVLQWQYRPLLLNGVPYEFLLTVVVDFHLGG